MRTGFFAFLSSKKKAVNKDSAISFGNEVLEAVKNSKGTTEEELAVEMKGVLDSMSVLKDCEAKDTLLEVVKDCFDNKEKVMADEQDVVITLDSMWNDINSESLSEIANAFAKLCESRDSEEEKEEPEKAEDKDSEEEKGEEEKEGESKDSEEEKEEPEKAEDKDSEEKETEKTDEKDGCNKDSAPELFATKDDILALKEELKSLVLGTVKDCLGLKDVTEPEGSALDSVNEEDAEIHRDYASFLD